MHRISWEAINSYLDAIASALRSSLARMAGLAKRLEVARVTHEGLVAIRRHDVIDLYC
jgi:hypothetical protein